MTQRDATEGGFDERWLQPGGIIPVDIPTTGALVREIQRLRALPSASAPSLTLPEGADLNVPASDERTLSVQAAQVVSGTVSETELSMLRDIWSSVRLQAEGSDWRRDSGESLAEWAYKALASRSRIAADERERCARVCEELHVASPVIVRALDCAAAIRALGPMNTKTREGK